MAGSGTSGTISGREDPISISEEGFSWTTDTKSLKEGFSSAFPRGNRYNGVFWKVKEEHCPIFIINCEIFLQKRKRQKDKRPRKG
jgi:hypothetical protein